MSIFIACATPSIRPVTTILSVSLPAGRGAKNIKAIKAHQRDAFDPPAFLVAIQNPDLYVLQDETQERLLCGWVIHNCMALGAGQREGLGHLLDIFSFPLEMLREDQYDPWKGTPRHYRCSFLLILP